MKILMKVISRLLATVVYIVAMPYLIYQWFSLRYQERKSKNRINKMFEDTKEELRRLKDSLKINQGK
jgi:Ca2+/Na+ antiporter